MSTAKPIARSSVFAPQMFSRGVARGGANRPVGLITGDIVRVDPIQRRQPRFRSVRFANRRGVSSSRAYIEDMRISCS